MVAVDPATVNVADQLEIDVGELAFIDERYGSSTMREQLSKTTTTGAISPQDPTVTRPLGDVDELLDAVGHVQVGVVGCRRSPDRTR
jgi:hypothetical protein